MIEASNAPTPYGGQLDRCQVCGDKYHREELVRTQVDCVQAEAQNQFSYSTYDGTYWVVDSASDSGTVSFGNHQDEARTILSNDNVITVLNGVQTWEGDGTLRTSVVSGSIDPLKYVVFSLQIGAWERSTDPELTVSLGVCNSDGSVKQEIRSWNFKGARRAWFCESAATLQAYGLGTGTGLFLYASVDNDDKWWADEMQLEVVNSESSPGTFIPTVGTSQTVSVDTPNTTTRVVCPRCFETVFKKSEVYGRTKLPPTAPPVRPRNQRY